jgi:hypothetical protein
MATQSMVCGSSSFHKLLPKVEGRFTWRAIFETSVERVPHLLIELRRLKVRGREAGVLTSPITRYTLGPSEKLPAQALLAQPLLDPDHTDLEPERNGMRSAHDSAKHSSGWVKHIGVSWRGLVVLDGERGAVRLIEGDQLGSVDV